MRGSGARAPADGGCGSRAGTRRRRRRRAVLEVSAGCERSGGGGGGRSVAYGAPGRRGWPGGEAAGARWGLWARTGHFSGHPGSACPVAMKTGGSPGGGGPGRGLGGRVPQAGYMGEGGPACGFQGVTCGHPPATPGAWHLNGGVPRASVSLAPLERGLQVGTRRRSLYLPSRVGGTSPGPQPAPVFLFTQQRVPHSCAS